MRCAKLILAVLLATLFVPAIAAAQTASSALVAGTVYDKTGAVVPKATIELLNEATSLRYNQESNEGGQYLFGTVAPGTYKVTVTAQGFRTWVQPTLKIDVAKSYTVNVTLEVGTLAETVEVQATVGADLQKTDATVGTSIGGDALKYLPTPNRSVAGLLILQPLVAPITAGVTTDVGGQVAGARSDQSTFLIDGGEATSNTEGHGGYNTQFEGEIRPVVPVPAESIEEFRVGTTNPNATFGRSQGGQVTMITKRGTNALHGSAYWYHQNDNLNANRWDNNASAIKEPELKDNRYGFTAGGPVMKDRVWLFGHYEGRRFPQSTTFPRVVPSASLRQGIMRFRDAAGNIVSYNFNPANGALTALCAGGACDPRGIGVSAVTMADINSLPAGTPGFTSVGDGLNLVGYRDTITTPITTEFAVVRLDYKVTDKWDFFASGRYHYYKQPGFQQIDIVGISGCQAPCATRTNPLQPRFYVAGVNGQITPRLLSETRISWLRHWWEWATTSPTPQVSGTAAALSLAGEGNGRTGSVKISDPINIDTQNARSRVWNGKDTFVSQNFTWLKGKHNVQFGGSYRFENIFHQRTDKVTGGLATGPIFYLNQGSFFRVPDAFRPPACGGGVTTNCLNSSGDVNRWNQFYAALMGIPDRSAQLLARDGDLNPLSLGTPLQAQVHIHAVESFVQDIWRVTPSFTATLGLTYQVQRPPTEELGRQMVPVFAATGNAFDLQSYYRDREAAAVKGQILNPDLAYTPIKHLNGQKYVTPIDWNNWGPRVAFAWHPGDSWWGIGGGKTVLRGGYSVTYTRMNGVGLVMTPILGVGLGEILSCKGPRSNGVCAGSSDPSNGFRIGVDGDGSTILPSTITPSPARIPFPVSKPYGETRSFAIDPKMTLGFSHGFDLTVQQELPWNLLVEVGYVGRLGRNLTQVYDVNATPFMMIDPTSGQSLAAAFDALAEAVRNGTAITPQPWFENIAGAACAADPAPPLGNGCSTFSSVSAYLVKQFEFEFSSGDLASPMQSSAGGISVLLFNNGQQEIDNIQTVVASFTGDGGASDYHAGFVTLRKRFSNGLTFDANYTYGHSIDLFGLNQENTQFSPLSPYRPQFDRAPSIFDRRHIFNFHWYYELPLGRGKRFSTDSGVLDKIIGGWHFAGIYTASTGLPLCTTGHGFNFNGPNYGTPNPQNPCLIPTFSSRPESRVHDTGGGSLNLFSDPDSVINSFRYPLMTRDTRFGFGALRGLNRWNLDFSLGKKTSITERVALVFSADFINALNHVNFSDPSATGNLDILDSSTFGVLDTQNNQPRFIQFGFRIEF